MPAFRRRTRWLCRLRLCLLRCTAVALLSLGLFAMPAAQSAPGKPTSPATTPPAAMSDEVRPYPGSWECRYGDGPIGASGERAWARPQTAADSDWHSCTPPGTPPGRGANDFLWMRTRLAGPSLPDPALFLLSVDQIFEAYLDGRLIYRFGVLDGPGRGRYAGHRPHYIPLGAGYQGKLLALRIYSRHINIGIVGQSKLGGRLLLMVATMRSGLDKLVTGAVLIAMGMAGLGLYLARRRDTIYGAYGGFAICVGTFVSVYSQTRTQILDHHVMWNHIEQLALFLMAPFFLRFMIALIGRGPFALTVHLLRLHWGFAALASLLVLTGIVPLMATVVVFQILLMFDVIYVIGIAGIAAAHGHLEARIFTAALVPPVLLVFYDLLAGLGLIPRPATILSHFGVAGFVATLALIPIRRIAALQKERERAIQLEVEGRSRDRRIADQAVLLESAARMAAGDLSTPIVADPKSPLRHLGETLDTMRRDLREKLRQLEENSAKVRSLNEELMRQIEQRSRRLLELLLSGQRAVLPQPSFAPLASGSMLGEIYRVIRGIGQGAAGAVYEVERTTDRQRLAAKVISGEADETALIRFAREAQILSRLSHPNLISIVDVDVSSSGTLFIIMELVKGTTLRNLRHRYGDLSFALLILRQIAVALAAVHERGIIHRGVLLRVSRREMDVCRGSGMRQERRRGQERIEYTSTHASL